MRSIATACGVFVLAVGSYLTFAKAVAIHREATAPLPDTDGPTGGCTLWFVGSSTIVKWQTLSTDMAPWDAHGRGVNGALIPQLTHWVGNEPAGPAPAAIVFYGGENDLDTGATAAGAMTSFERFMAQKARRYGALPVVAISLKPSPARWSERPQQTVFNAALQKLAATRDDLDFIDIRPLMLVNDRPGPFYTDDGIHMNAAGYASWTAWLRPALARSLPQETVRRCGAAG
ncbi:hypothetical protein ASG67_00310 [Sphingomonas sp. Leaf339]|nr:hypothetical protein ASG67_00310 [Sphingomonas sp. Leaf339]